MSPSFVYLCLTFLCFVSAQDEASFATCNYESKYLNATELTNITKICKDKACLMKCCPEKEILITYQDGLTYCKDSSYFEHNFNVTNLLDYSMLEIYDKDITREPIRTKKTIHDFKDFQYIDFANDPFKPVDFTLPLFKLYFLEDGRLAVRRLNHLDRWFVTYNPGEFCMNRYLELSPDGTVNSFAPQIVFYEFPQNDTGISYDSPSERAFWSAYGMLISCFFMALVLIVYALLKELQNLAGLMLMAYIASFIAFFFLRSVHVYGNEYKLFDETVCTVFTLFVYYTMLSSFSWMNVMSFDIWWTLRGLRKKLPTNKRGILVKFGWYCLYAWGLPLVPTLFIIIVDNLDLTHLPNFIKPFVFIGGNGFFDPDSHKLYVIAPISLMVCGNLILFMMTAYNIWLVRKGIDRYTASESKAEHRFVLYLKLSLLMGTSWIFEILSMVITPDSPFWYISDAYNTLIGFFIFIIFVCKRKIFLHLCLKFSIDNEFVRKERARAGNSTLAASSRTTKSFVRDTSAYEPSVTIHPSHLD